MGYFMASVLVDGRGSLVNVEGFSDLLWELLLLPHQDLGVIQCVSMTGGRGVFHEGRVEVFSICVFSEPGAQHSGCFTNVFLITFATLNTVYHHTLGIFIVLVLGVYQHVTSHYHHKRPCDMGKTSGYVSN